MAKDTISQYSKTAGSNTDLQSVSCAEGMSPSDVNNWMRELMVDLASLYDGTQSLATLKTTTALSAANGSVSAPSLQATADTNSGVFFPAADSVGITAGGVEQFRFGSNPIPGGGYKNLLVNGSMAIAQRSSQTAVGASDGDRCAVDMWKVQKRGSPEGRVTATQTADTGMNLNGHEYTCKLDCTTAESAVAATEAHTLSQSIEAQNLQGLKFGTANAEAITLSFWFSSPKTGIHCASLYLSDTGYSQVKEFTISSANTWEKFSLTFSANTSQKINNDTGSGMIVSFALTAGSNFQVSADTWASGEDFATSNQQNLLDNTSNNVSLAGCQLEIGSVATDFAYESVATIMTKCPRYLEVVGREAQYTRLAMGYVASTSTVYGNLYYTRKREAPSLTKVGTFYGNDFGAGTVGGTMVISHAGTQSCLFELSGGSGLTGGQAISMATLNSTSDYLIISSEL